MNAYPGKKSIFLLLFIFLGIQFVFSFNVCNVNFEGPFFNVSSHNQSVLLVDVNGNIYFNGKDHLSSPLSSVSHLNLFGMSFDLDKSFFDPGNFFSGISDFSGKKGLGIVVSGKKVALFSSDNKIYTSGKGAFQGSQGGCLPDGNYCNGNTLEFRDYFCNILGYESGSCTYNVKSSENCLTKPSEDSDGGSNYLLKGTVKDYIGCSGSSCSFTTYTDVCTDTTHLKEYNALGSGIQEISKNCQDYEYSYCKGSDEVWKTNWDCGLGKCEQKPDSLVQICSVSATQYSSWSCSDDFHRVRTVTTYSPTCSSGVCGESSSVTTETETAPSGYYCSGGNWEEIKDCEGYWDTQYGSCSVSCGGGNYDKKFIVTQYPTPGGKACPSPSFIDNGGDVCNTQSCYTYSWYIGPWSSCSASCSPTPQIKDPIGAFGTETRDVYCLRSDGVKVSDSYCPSPKPSTSQSCSIKCYTYSWYIGPWSSCSATCLGISSIAYGIETRDVYCLRSDGVKVSDSYCPSPKPSTSQSCSETCCSPFVRLNGRLLSEEELSSGCGLSGTYVKLITDQGEKTIPVDYSSREFDGGVYVKNSKVTVTRIEVGGRTVWSGNLIPPTKAKRIIPDYCLDNQFYVQYICK